jgi:hypothetical protein
MKIVGGMKISPFVFYSMTIREAKLAIKGHRNEMHEAYISNLYATTNAVGSCLGGKNYKPIDPFEEPKKASKASNKQQMTAEYVARLKAFGIDARDVGESEFDDNWNDLSTEEKRKLLFNK